MKFVLCRVLQSMQSYSNEPMNGSFSRLGNMKVYEKNNFICILSQHFKVSDEIPVLFICSALIWFTLSHFVSALMIF